MNQSKQGVVNKPTVEKFDISKQNPVDMSEDDSEIKENFNDMPYENGTNYENVGDYDNGNDYDNGVDYDDDGSTGGNSYESFKSTSDPSSSSRKKGSKVKGVSESEPVQHASTNDLAEPQVSADLVNQLVKESERKSVPLNSPLLQQSKEKAVHNFEPNDTQSFSGASLDNAFERPVADTTDTDVIDLQKNNVKNYNAKDYLPKEVNDDWFNTDFSQAKYKMNDDKLINTDKYIIGINTVGQSLKNASYDIRGAINVPKYTVSPWNNSTIEPDYNIKPLC
jgi:hypothetical protein